MGYEVYITRRRDWWDDASGEAIDAGIWRSFVAGDPTMRLDGFAEATLPDGETLRIESPGLAVWTAYSGHGVNGNMAWFDHRDGNIVVKNPDEEILGHMRTIAKHLDARVQGEEGESLDTPDTSPAHASVSTAKTPSRPWWKQW